MAAVAVAIGLHARRVEEQDELEDALRDALAHPGPSLVDVVVDSSAITVSPSIAPAQAWGYSLARLKELWLSAYDDHDTGAG